MESITQPIQLLLFPLKRCRKCNQEKDVSCFSKGGKDRLKNSCKSCDSAWNKTYQQQHRDEIARRRKEFIEAHPERYNDWHSRYRQKYGRAVTDRVADWKDNHPEETSASGVAYNARVRAQGVGGGKFTPQEWLNLKAYYGYTCLCCGKKEPEIKLNADHVIPIISGGSSDIGNIQPLCFPCNRRKGKGSTDYRPIQLPNSA